MPESPPAPPKLGFPMARGCRSGASGAVMGTSCPRSCDACAQPAPPAAGSRPPNWVGRGPPVPPDPKAGGAGLCGLDTGWVQGSGVPQPMKRVGLGFWTVMAQYRGAQGPPWSGNGMDAGSCPL